MRKCSAYSFFFDRVLEGSRIGYISKVYCTSKLRQTSHKSLTACSKSRVSISFSCSKLCKKFTQNDNHSCSVIKEFEPQSLPRFIVSILSRNFSAWYSTSRPLACSQVFHLYGLQAPSSLPADGVNVISINDYVYSSTSNEAKLNTLSAAKYWHKISLETLFDRESSRLNDHCFNDIRHLNSDSRSNIKWCVYFLFTAGDWTYYDNCVYNRFNTIGSIDYTVKYDCWSICNNTSGHDAVRWLDAIRNVSCVRYRSRQLCTQSSLTSYNITAAATVTYHFMFSFYCNKSLQNRFGWNNINVYKRLLSGWIIDALSTVGRGD